MWRREELEGGGNGGPLITLEEVHGDVCVDRWEGAQEAFKAEERKSVGRALEAS